MPEKQHILVIDDDVQFVDIVETLLESVGYQVSHAYQAERGMFLAREETGPNPARRHVCPPARVGRHHALNAPAPGS